MFLVIRPFVLALSLCMAAAAFAQDAPPVSVAETSEQPIVRVVQVTGTVTSPRSATLSPSVGGLIQALELDAGDRVVAGDVVVGLDAELARLTLEREEARLAQAKTALADSRRRLEEAERVGVTQAIPASQIKSIAAEVEQDEAAVAEAEAAVAQQRSVVARHRIRAPFDGVISERLSEIGEWANPGDPLVELVATEDLRFDFRVPQEFYGTIRPETRVVLQSDALPGTSIEGKVRAIVPVKDPGARTFLLRVVAERAPSASITPGMSARGELYIDTERTGVVVSRDALLRYPDGREVVWVLDRSGELPRVRQRQVTTGLQFDGLIEIRQGLEPGTMVVTRGNEALQDGQTVAIR
jgi:RND family efflux transporter MFP subunit